MTSDTVSRGAELVASGKYAISTTVIKPKSVETLVAEVNAVSNMLDGTCGADISSLLAASRDLTRKIAAISSPDLLSSLVNAAQLDDMKFADLEEHVPGLITEGLFILGGPPKAGKSLLVGNLVCGVASGGMVLGRIHVKQRPVLLISLEDSHRRLQSRLKKIMHGQPLPKNLDVLIEVNPNVLLATITTWLQRHRDSAPMVVLDTLGKARHSSSSNANQYQEDYTFAGRVKAVIDGVPGAALVAVHHTRKMSAEDFLDTLSGTQGIAGAADGIVVLSRKRKSDEGILSVTGRDIEENEYAVKLDGIVWSLDGMDIVDAAATVDTRRERAAEGKLGDVKLDAIRFVNGRESTTPAELAEHLGIDNKVAGTRLGELFKTGYIAKPSQGHYAPLPRETRESSETAGQVKEPPPADSRVSRNSQATVTCSMEHCDVQLVNEQSIANGYCAECAWSLANTLDEMQALVPNE
ncbi:AAA family ATPase [Mycolicibacterium fortuitum]|uniref:AAA family ATPase n=2 Tax=Mycolicibacterium fortuitum TaxID=1766 RepID=A0AAE5AFA4_MYCFO|nr:AAA family ATPase [Mycolicibacterium fortuitum]MCV7142756.1 AAA family ATPase [Mycolicibacterium fortuitum]MDV7190591.1 AAA family ATPase [Mycolicibacterium fortuitum]MDV7207930.1 AAA family ATPase [Mycolicibacterium fortuitum]MDV7229855.1 AAA family ATPase [Mycolicibacterium fortuitum]MDV7257782.1 AAA family ATPase [Mycolicibacterium fortuitum]